MTHEGERGRDKKRGGERKEEEGKRERERRRRERAKRVPKCRGTAKAE